MLIDGLQKKIEIRWLNISAIPDVIGENLKEF